MIDSWQRIGTTAVRSGPWIVAKVEVNGAMSYEVTHDDTGSVALARCGSFQQAKAFIREYEFIDKKING